MDYRFDPELAPLVEMLPTVDLEEAGVLDQLRSTRLELPGADDLDDVVRVAEVIDLPDRTVSCRWYRPPADTAHARPAVVLLHGGGFVLRTNEAEAWRAGAIVRGTGAVVLAIDYRLAPEFPYPAALDDVTETVRWMFAAASSLGIDPERVAVVGESAGGALAAAAALRLRDEGGPRLCGQGLLIPVLDDRLATQSMQRFDDTPMWTRSMAAASWRRYLGALEGDVPATAAPARAVDLTGLPPTYLTCMEFDPLRDEALEYGRRLLEADVPLELHCYAGGFHGATTLPFTAMAQRASAELVSVLGRWFA